MNWIACRLLGVYDEIHSILSNISACFMAGVKQFWYGPGGWWRKAADLCFCIGLAWLIPTFVVGLAAASFVDTTDKLTTAMTAMAAFVALEFIALYCMEVIVLLAVLQFSRLTCRYLFHVRRRENACSTKCSEDFVSDAQWQVA